MCDRPIYGPTKTQIDAPERCEVRTYKRIDTVRDSNSWVQGGKPYLLNGFEELKKNLPQYVPRGPLCCLRFSSIFEKKKFFDEKIFFCFFKFFVKLKRGTKVETNLK